MSALESEPEAENAGVVPASADIMDDEQAEGAQAAPSDLSAMTKAQLQEMAAAAGFEGIKSSTTKADLIKLLSE